MNHWAGRDILRGAAKLGSRPAPPQGGMSKKRVPLSLELVQRKLKKQCVLSATLRQTQ